MIHDPQEKQDVARAILETLPEWFGIPEAREEYIRKTAEQIMLVSSKDSAATGFLCLKETGKDTMEIAVMGVLKEYHRQGIGSALVEAAKEIAQERGCSFLQVKTVRMGRYPEYDATNCFYLHCGFKEFEVIPTLWDEWNPCQIYVMAVGIGKHCVCRGNKMTIRHVEQHDKAAWFALDHDFPETGFDEKVRTRQGYVCVEDGKIVGILRFNLFWDSIPFCTMLHVDAAHQGRGYGRMLMERWEQDMKSAGCGMLMTSTQVDEQAQHFYRKLGYKDAGGFVLDLPGYEQPMEMMMVKGI